MTYQVLARKWRPKNFETLVGQEHVVRALINALDNQRLHHAYLFTGTRGVGKTTLARIFAKCLNCESGVSSKPCGQCNTCQEIDAGRFIDLIEVDAASRTKVEDTRELLDNVQYSPTKGRYKVYLIDEVHMLSGHSFNALLKTLEEPPPHIKFLLATTDPQKLPVTVLSRCLQFHLKNMPVERIFEYLSQVLKQEQITFDENALQLLGRAANGSMRDALSLLDQAIAYGNGIVKTTDVRQMLGTIEQTYLFDLLTALIAQDGNALLEVIAKLADQAADFSQVLEDLLSWLHQIALAQVVPDALNYHFDHVDQIKTFAKQLTGEEVQLYYQIGLIGRRDLAFAPSAKIGFEMVLLRMLAFRPETTVKLSTPNVTNNINQPITKTVSHAAIETSNWAELISKLNLAGPTRALATHCTLEKMTANEIVLALEPNQAPLLNERQKQRLNEAFNEYFQKPMAVIINIAKTGTTTPADLTKQHQAQQHAKATEAIAQDQNVQAIISTFNATILPESIKGIDK